MPLKLCLTSILCLAVTLTSGCVSSPASTSIHFNCSADAFTAQFMPGSVVLTLRDGTELRLKEQRSASGAQYADEHWLFWNKGDEAILKRDGKAVGSDCRASH